MSPRKLPPKAAGVKRPAAALLPPFEPVSLPAIPPRPHKRRALGSSSSFASSAGTGRADHGLMYPTPVPSSSPGLCTSAGSALSPSPRSVLSRASTPPSSAPSKGSGSLLPGLPCVELPDDGSPVRIGRNRTRSHYVVRGGRSVSRVHLEARYFSNPPRVVIDCKGRNGIKLQCLGETWDLKGGFIYTNDVEDSDMTVDVQGTRIVVRWPRRNAEVRPSTPEVSSREDSPGIKSEAGADDATSLSHSSPLLGRSFSGTIGSPVSPSPASFRDSAVRMWLVRRADGTHDAITNESESSEAGRLDCNVYPDSEEGKGPAIKEEDVGPDGAGMDADDEGTDLKVKPEEDLDEERNSSDEENNPIARSFGPVGDDNAFSPSASVAASPPELSDEEYDPDEKNDPVAQSDLPNDSTFVAASPSESEDEEYDSDEDKFSVHSFGGSSSSRRTSVTASRDDAVSEPRTAVEHLSRAAPSLPTSDVLPPPSPAPRETLAPKIAPSLDREEIANHASNQLAFSSVASTPISTILSKLPSELTQHGLLTTDILGHILGEVPCLGVIARQGKDAAGKPLSDEYYYIPENDSDGMRCQSAIGTGRSGLRGCRKSHKQYFWKPPPKP